MIFISRLTAAFVVVAVVLAIAPLPAEGQGSVESDRAALVALYDATDGDNWNNNDNWNTDAPLSDWYGVETDNGRVCDLYLDNNNLTGEIPRELSSLTNLEWLLVDRNNLTGEIPRELGRLKNLERLHLENNNLTGGIPRELGSLTNLERLYLSRNNLTGEIPRELGRLTNLASLYLLGNMLTGVIPEELRRFEGTINPQRGGVYLPVGTPVPALPFVGALLLACGLWCMGRRKMLRSH